MAARSPHTPDYCGHLLKHFNDLRKWNKFCDLILVCGPKNRRQEFPAHRVVMMECSEYFHTMSKSGFKDGQAERFEFDSDIIDPSDLQTIINYVYTGHLEINSEDVVWILQTARFLMVDAVVELCADFLYNTVTPDNYTATLQAASRCELSNIRRKILETYLEDFATNYEQEFFDLKFEEFAKVLESNWLRLSSEYSAFELVLKWVRHDVNIRRRELASLIGLVRMPLMTTVKLWQVGQIQEITTDDECKDLLTKARSYRTWVTTQPYHQTNQTQVRCEIAGIIFSSEEGIRCMNAGVNFKPPETVINKSAYVASVNNFLFCFSKDGSKQCHRYDPRFNHWFPLPCIKEPRRNAACVVDGNFIYIIGGWLENNADARLTVERFSIEECDWEMCPALPIAIYNHAATVHQKRIYISGGQLWNSTTSCEVLSTDDPESGHWTYSEALSRGRHSHCMVAVGTCLYLIGGYYGSSDSTALTGEIEMLCDSTWTLCKPTLSFRPSGAFLAMGNIYIFAGVTKANGMDYYFHKVCVYSPANDRFVSEMDALSFDLEESTTYCVNGHRVSAICDLKFPSEPYKI